MNLEEHARESVERLFSMGPGLLTIPYLIRQHPDLSADEAEELLHFARSRTIHHKTCYGDGSIMYPKWKAWLAEVASL